MLSFPLFWLPRSRALLRQPTWEDTMVLQTSSWGEVPWGRSHFLPQRVPATFEGSDPGEALYLALRGNSLRLCLDVDHSGLLWWMPVALSHWARLKSQRETKLRLYAERPCFFSLPDLRCVYPTGKPRGHFLRPERVSVNCLILSYVCSGHCLPSCAWQGIANWRTDFQ